MCVLVGARVKLRVCLRLRPTRQRQKVSCLHSGLRYGIYNNIHLESLRVMAETLVIGQRSRCRRGKSQCRVMIRNSDPRPRRPHRQQPPTEYNLNNELPRPSNAVLEKKNTCEHFGAVTILQKHAVRDKARQGWNVIQRSRHLSLDVCDTPRLGLKLRD